MISLEQGKTYYPKAEQQMQQALSIGKAFSDSTILVPIYHSLSMLYSLMPKPGQALLYARLNYSGLKDTQHCYRTFLLLGNAYFINGQYDSAGIFLQKILKAERYYDTKADACMRLSEIAQKKGIWKHPFFWKESGQCIRTVHKLISKGMTFSIP